MMLRQRDVRCEAARAERLHEPPPRIQLPGSVAQAGRLGKRVVVVVPRLAHRQQAQSRHVVALHRRAVDMPVAPAVVMGDEPDQPVPGQRDRHAHAHAPHDPTPSAQTIEHDRQRQLHRHPASIEKSIVPRLGDDGFNFELRRMCQQTTGVQVPEPVHSDVALVDVKRMAARLTLGPIPHFVHQDHFSRAAHPDQHTKGHQDLLQPPWALEAAVNQETMESDGMAAAEGHHCQTAGDE